MAKTAEKKLAVWRNCAGMADGAYAHSMRDYCSTCAPWWERIPTCPDCKGKLLKMGRTKCRRCKTWVFVGPDLTKGENAG